MLMQEMITHSSYAQQNAECHTMSSVGHICSPARAWQQLQQT